MKWMSAYFIGYVIFMVGVFLALWQLDVLDQIGPTWSLILGVLALGLGVMIAVANSGRKENVTIDTK